jgi:hypothetical protein
VRYLDVIGPGTWLHEDYLMEESTFFLIIGLIAFCFAAIAVSVIVLFVVMRHRRMDDPKEQEGGSDEANVESEES